MVNKYTPELTKKVIKSDIGNYMGLQPARYILSKAVRSIRRATYTPVKKSEKNDENIVSGLLKNGYVTIENFFEEEVRLKILNEFNKVVDEKMGEDLSIEDGGTVVRRRGLSIDDIKEGGLSSVIKLVDNSYIWSSLSKVHGSEFKNENSTFWFDVIENGEDSCSVNNRHTDVFFDTYKIWYFLDEVKPEDGPLVYCPTTQKFSLWRVGFEYSGSLPKNGAITQPWDLSDDRLEKLKLKEKAFTVPANTLVIVNTHGFHRRGDASPGSKRRQIHFSARGTAFG